jgi:hypothetical protein
MVTTMFGLSPIGPSLVPRLHGIETHEPGSRESKPLPSMRERRARDGVEAQGCLARMPRERPGVARRGLDARIQSAGSRRASAAGALFPICRCPKGERGDFVHPARLGRWLARPPTGRTSGEVPEETGDRIFENTFFKNNDLRNLWFTLPRRAGLSPPSGSPVVGSSGARAPVRREARVIFASPSREHAPSARSGPRRAPLVDGVARESPAAAPPALADGGRPTRWGRSRWSAAVAAPRPSTYW